MLPLPCEDGNTHNDQDNDIGKWLGRSAQMTVRKKVELLKRCWTPSDTYNYAEDASAHNLGVRKFRHEWLQVFSPWLAYSSHLKGPLCLYCVLFPPSVVHGVLGGFVVRPFLRFKNMHDQSKTHASSQWHKSAVLAAKSFLDELPVDVQMISAHKQLIEKNRNILKSIISSIIFCGIHDSPLRGKELHQGNNF